jgi:hypothetical protein
MATLNVLLHGLFVIVDREDYLLALAPDLDGQHVYRAGNFLGCTELHRGMYRLAGVDPGGKANFNPDLNFILQDKVLKPDASHLAHATILFRRPQQIFSLRPVVFRPEDFTGADKKFAGGLAATTQVLVYSCPSLPSVRLVGHPWLPPQTPGDGPFNLHIYSEEDTRIGLLKHHQNALDRLAGLFQNLDLQLADDAAMSELAKVEEQLAPGVIGQELEPLSFTHSRLSDQGHSIQSLLAGNVELFQEIWAGDKPRPLSAVKTSCSTIISREI